MMADVMFPRGSQGACDVVHDLSMGFMRLVLCKFMQYHTLDAAGRQQQQNPIKHILLLLLYSLTRRLTTPDFVAARISGS